jgi:hypothetical protein
VNRILLVPGQDNPIPAYRVEPDVPRGEGAGKRKAAFTGRKRRKLMKDPDGFRAEGLPAVERPRRLPQDEQSDSSLLDMQARIQTLEQQIADLQTGGGGGGRTSNDPLLPDPSVE